MSQDMKVLVERVEIAGDCWLWRGSLRRGYGRIKRAGTTYQAHRWVYELLVGPIPEGLELDHLCRVRRCVNPDHLEPVTRAVNHRRGAGRFNSPGRGQTDCKRGHSLGDAYIRGTGSRSCRPCALQHGRATYAARKEAA